MARKTFSSNNCIIHTAARVTRTGEKTTRTRRTRDKKRARGTIEEEIGAGRGFVKVKLEIRL